jgi:hypothetical protein
MVDASDALARDFGPVDNIAMGNGMPRTGRGIERLEAAGLPKWGSYRGPKVGSTPTASLFIHTNHAAMRGEVVHDNSRLAALPAQE